MKTRARVVRRHPFVEGFGLEFCVRCNAPEGSWRFHPPIVWLKPHTTAAEVRDALDGCTDAAPLVRQAQIEEALVWLGHQQRMFSVLDLARHKLLRSTIPTRKLAADAIEHLIDTGRIFPARGIGAEPLTDELDIAGVPRTAARYYLPSRSKE